MEKYAQFIDPVISEDINRGFALPLPIELLKKLPNSSLAHFECHKQSTINAQGETIPKYRLTHDQSFPGLSGQLVNSRVKKELLPPIMYSFVLCRLIHYVINVRRLLPTTKIFTCKIDLDAAYHCCSMPVATSWESMMIYDGLLFVALRLPFGGSPCPKWSVISETITDLANSILHNPFWDHENTFDPLSKSIETPVLLPDDLPYHPAKDLAVQLPENLGGYIDIYIDDILGVVPDLGDNVKRLYIAIPLAIHTFARPTDESDIIPGRDIISLKKFQVEGQLEERKKVLGWDFNTRALRISLPREKLRDWSSDIAKMISTKKVQSKNLESSLGRLNHVACILQPMRHYLGRLYQALQRSNFSNGWCHLSDEEVSDLHLMLSFLRCVNKGVSMNNLVFRKPSMIYHSDASEFGLGGYNIITGIGWHFELPEDCRLRTSLNSLEFLACTISIWMDHFMR